MTEQKYEGYSLKQIMIEGLGDAAKAHMLKLWNVASSASPSDRERALEAAREGLRKVKKMHDGGVKLIEEEIGD